MIGCWVIFLKEVILSCLIFEAQKRFIIRENCMDTHLDGDSLSSHKSTGQKLQLVRSSLVLTKLGQGVRALTTGLCIRAQVMVAKT